MKSFLKEQKRIVPSYIKFASSEEIESEITGYSHARRAGLQTVEVLHSSENVISLEYVDGMSCFRYLEMLNPRKDKDREKMEVLLRHLLSDVVKFQSSKILFENIEPQPYEVVEKTREVVEVMRLVQHPQSVIVSAKIPRINELFCEYATFSFRDSTPKNVLLKGVKSDNWDELPIQDILSSIKHIDFRSVFELTTSLDDVISILFHYMIPNEVREKLLKEFDSEKSTENFIISYFVRIARFWGRRHYYRLKHPKLFKKRYKLEDLSFYDQQFSNATKNLMELLGS